MNWKHMASSLLAVGGAVSSAFATNWSYDGSGSQKYLLDDTACIYVPRGDARWQAFMADPEEMTPWNNLDASTQNQYWSRYPDGKTPKGMTLKTTGSNRFGRMWVFQWSPKSNATILTLR